MLFYFVDYDRALVHVNRLTVFNTPHKINMPNHLVSALLGMCEHSETRARQNKLVIQILAINKGERHVPLFDIPINEIVCSQNGTLKIYTA
jgi:hypothetical protein